MTKRNDPSGFAAAIYRDDLAVPEGVVQGEHEHHDTFHSTRASIYRDRKFVIHTTYKIEIDGKPLTMHTKVLDDGSVHCHGLPNYSFSSALDMVKKIIDSERPLPNDELGSDCGDPDGHGEGSGHDGQA
ncbi:MAG: hypothetical protein V3W41_17285 [Planctomycetota bacterium]